MDVEGSGPFEHFRNRGLVLLPFSFHFYSIFLEREDLILWSKKVFGVSSFDLFSRPSKFLCSDLFSFLHSASSSGALPFCESLSKILEGRNPLGLSRE